MWIEQWLNGPVWAPEEETGGGEATPAPEGDGEEASLISGSEGSPDEVVDEDVAANEAESADEDEGSSEGSTTPVTLEALTVPEGISIDPDLGTAFVDLMNNEELSSSERAQGLIDLQVKAVEKGQEAAMEAAKTLWSDQQVEWQTEVRSLPEIGGANLDRTLADIKKGLDAAGASAEFFEAMDVTGFGNHPEAVKMFHKLVKGYNEGGNVSGSSTGGPMSQADKMFGTG